MEVPRQLKAVYLFVYRVFVLLTILLKKKLFFQIREKLKKKNMLFLLLQKFTKHTGQKEEKGVSLPPINTFI